MSKHLRNGELCELIHRACSHMGLTAADTYRAYRMALEDPRGTRPAERIYRAIVASYERVA